MAILGRRLRKGNDAAPDAPGESRPAEPACTVCGLTARGVVRRVMRRDPNALIVGMLVGKCARCGASFCHDHALQEDDLEYCRVCRGALAFAWAEVGHEVGRITPGGALGSEA